VLKQNPVNETMRRLVFVTLLLTVLISAQLLRASLI
jgi:hypothetical protein